MWTRILPVFFFIFSFSLGLTAQEPNLGLEPPGTKWQRIRTPYADVIFEPQARLKAQRVANIVNYLAARDSLYIGGPAQNVPIILHSQSLLPAGVPFIAPWRSDWTTTAPQDPFMGAIPWIEGLTIHEYRHHQQMARAKPGFFSGLLRVLIGQTGWFVSVLTIQPNWFFEGDATYAETVLSNGGRGRMPKFHMEYRAMRLSGFKYNYEQASRFSRKVFVPNIYREGYYLTAFGRKEFGVDIWTRVLDDTYKNKNFFYPFSRSLEKFTGFTTRRLYAAAMEDLDSIWGVEDESITPSESRLVTSTPKKVYTNYRFPHYSSEQDLIAEKSSFEELRGIYVLDDSGNESLLVRPGFVTPDHVQVNASGRWICWSENAFHPRWGLKDYANIYLYDLETKKKRQVTKRGRFYSPSITSDGGTLAAIHFDESSDQQLVLVDVGSGAILKKFDNKEGGQYAYPRLSGDGESIIYGYTTLHGNSLFTLDTRTEKVEELLPATFNVSSRPAKNGDWVYFSGTHSGINNIYALHVGTRETFKVTNSRFGAFEPQVSPAGTKLAYSEYTALGYEIREIDMRPHEWPSVELGRFPNPFPDYRSVAEIEGGSITQKVDDIVYPVEDFKPTQTGLLKFHSWIPSISESEYGIEFQSSNIMSNTAATVASRYNVDDRVMVLESRLSYGAFFPILDLGYSYNVRGRKSIYDGNYVSTELSWREHQISGGFRVPLNLSRGINTGWLRIGSHVSQIRLSNDPIKDIIPQGRELVSGSFTIEAGRIRNLTRKQFASRWGQQLGLRYVRSLDKSNYGETLEADGTFYFPGVHKTHSIFSNIRYRQERLRNAYRFESLFENPRGFGMRHFSLEERAQFETLLVFSNNYLMPVAFPDVDFGSVLYVHSIVANPFYEFSIGRLDSRTTFLRSIGLDVTFEMTTLRLFRTSLTFRGLYRIDIPDPMMDPIHFDVVFNITDLAF